MAMDVAICLRILDYALRDNLVNYALAHGRTPDDVIWDAVREYLAARQLGA